VKIAHVIWTQFPVAGYGGTERVCFWLAQAQSEMGHEVTVLCRPGSRLPFGRVVEIPEKIESLDAYLPPDTDIVQLYGTPGYQISAPFLVNIGGNGQPGEQFPANTVFVSANHAARHGWSEFVHNGINLAEYPFQPRKENSALFLAKASWRVKNLRGAIQIARAAGLPIEVAGGRAPLWEHWRGGVKSHGTVDGAEKLALLQKAAVYLFPVVWEEPFGISVVEALASGTPVVVTPRGALPEIVTPACGVIGNTFSELVEAVEKARRLDPGACRARVEEAFTHQHMAEKYLFYYKRILAHGKLRDGIPAAIGNPQQKIYYSA
jgi:hypothetical protein